MGKRYVIAMPGQAFEREGMALRFADNPSFKRMAAGFNSLTSGRFEAWVTTARMEEIGDRFTAPSVMVLYGEICAEIAAERFGQPAAVSGYSLGFYAAALFARSLQVRDVLKWLERVNAENARSFPPGEFSFAVATGITHWEIDELLRGWKMETVRVANINNPRQVVLTGPAGDIESVGMRLRGRLMDYQVLSLDVPLHTEYMDEARGNVSLWWDTVLAAAPKCPLISPVDGRIIQSGEMVKNEMARALTAPNDWVSVCNRISQMNIDWVLDLSPGGELGRMVRWTNRNTVVKPVSVLWKGED